MMRLFSKKPPCPICGGKISWFLPTKIEGEHICDSCSNKIDMQDELLSCLTIQQLKEYLLFYEQNYLLRETFVISEKIDFGLWDTKLIFDYENKLFCLSKSPDKTIFEGAQLKSFTITEDSTPLFEGSAAGILNYSSTIPEKVLALAPQINQYITNRLMAESIELLDDENDENYYHHIPTMDIPEPFRAFNVELHFEHPYWNIIKCDMDGPIFSNNYPDINDYMNDYYRSIEEIEKLVRALASVAFPNAEEQAIEV